MPKFILHELVETNRLVIIEADTPDEAAADAHNGEETVQIKEICQTVIIEAIEDPEGRIYHYNHMQKRYTQ